MALNCGIVGLPNVGKSTIFSAVTSAPAEAANYPFCTIDPNIGIVAVPDKRLDERTAAYHCLLLAYRERRYFFTTGKGPGPIFRRLS